MDDFLEKFQMAFDPPSFSENYVAIFFMMDMVECMQGGTSARFGSVKCPVEWYDY